MIELIMLIPIIILIFWIIYQIPIAIAAIKIKNINLKVKLSNYKPKFSLIIPAKNEEKVIGRCIQSIIDQDYPKDKIEIIVVDGKSTDNTRKIVEEYMSKNPGIIKLVKEKDPNGKPKALNLGLKHSTGEIIGVFDADSILEKDTLNKIASQFDKNTIAIQTRVKSVNKDENILTSLISIEENVWYSLILNGRQKLNLFTPFTGSSLFIKKEILEKLKGWKEDSLAEDIELSVRMLKNGYEIKYVNDISTWQEAPNKLKTLFKQRLRWYRGYVETALKYGILLKNINRKTIDAEIMLIGPIIMAISLLCYLTGIISLVNPLLATYATPLIYTINTFTIAAILLVLIYNRPITKKKIITAISIYAYWIIQATIALKVIVDIILRKPYKWIKTTKTGKVTSIKI